jgi:aryl-alcohol dehydrogenase-like predicted oxidoreductase
MKGESMSKLKLGTSDLKSASIAFGGNVFGWTIDEATSHLILDAFVDAGFNLIDTSNTYGPRGEQRIPGTSETILGSWLKKSGKRNKVLIATKAGREFSGEISGLSKKAIFKAVEGSLSRLGIETIDLYQSHTDDPATAPEETLEAYNELIRQGKVRAIGASNFTAERLRQSLEVSREKGYAEYQVIQPLYNLYERQKFEGELESLAKSNQLGVISHSSLARGFLTGKYRSEADLGQSARGTSVKRYLNERGLSILNALDYVSKGLDTTPAQASLAWLISRQVIPIVSATSLKQLDEVLGAARLRLNEAALAYLNRASSYDSVLESHSVAQR